MHALRNPSLEDAVAKLGKSKYGELRGLVESKTRNIWLWEAEKADHKTTAEALGLDWYEDVIANNGRIIAKTEGHLEMILKRVRKVKEDKRLADLLAEFCIDGVSEKNCGTGAGGFKPGNSCARGGSGGFATSGGGGDSEKEDIGGIESGKTLKALARVHKRSERNATESLEDFASEFSYWMQEQAGGEPVDYSPEEAKKAFDEMMEKAEVVVAFSPNKAIGDQDSESSPSLQDVLAADSSPKIKNRFESGATTVEQSDENRLAYERGSFGDIMDEVPVGDKPKYGTLRFSDDDPPAGDCGFYGSAAFVLDKEAIKSRVTVSPYDTSENAGWNDKAWKDNGSHPLISSFENPYEAMTNSPQAIRAAGYPREFVRYLEDKGLIAGGGQNLRNEANDYVESQIFGSLPLNKSVVKKILVSDSTGGMNQYRRRMNSLREPGEPELPMLTRDSHYASLIAISKKTGIPIEFKEEW